MHQPSETQLVEMAATLSAVVQQRWEEAKLEPSLGDDVRAGLAALVFMEASLDRNGPWEIREVLNLSGDHASDTLSTERLPNESKPA